jgi:K+-sensing histidine kinase KdpD
VLVAYDGSPASKRAVQAAVDFAREGAQVIGVTVRAPTDNADTEAPSTKLVELIATHAGSFGVRLSTELRTGHPAQEILAAARTHQADLIVLGHSGRSVVSRIDLVPDFVPVLGYADDAIIVTAILRMAMRRAGLEPIRGHWPGTDDGSSASCGCVARPTSPVESTRPSVCDRGARVVVGLTQRWSSL